MALPIAAGGRADAVLTGASDLRSERLPIQIPFVMNKGQMDERVKFYATTPDGIAYVTRSGAIVYDLARRGGRENAAGWSLKEELIGARVGSVTGQARAETTVSSFVGNDTSRWKSDVPTYHAVSLGDVYEGIGLTLRLQGSSVEKLFRVEAGASPGAIRIRVSGATGLRTNAMGQLEADTGLGTVVFTKPVAYQERGGIIREVSIGYAIEGSTYGFRVGEYDRKSELVIDPSIRATYLGGRGDDYIHAVTRSRSAVYVAGSVDSVNFPGTEGGAQPVGSGPRDAFVAVLSADLKTLIQATYLGGNGNDDAHAIALSGSRVYVAGSTDSADLPGITGAPQPYKGGLDDGFLGLLTSDLKTLVRATYVGGSHEDAISTLAVANGVTSPYAVFVAGNTRSPNFPGTPGGAQAVSHDPIQQDGGIYRDAFVAVFDPELNALTQATYLGGMRGDRANAMVVVPGFVYVAGGTHSLNFPMTASGAQTLYGGGSSSVANDGFVALLTSDLTTLVRATYLGGLYTDEAWAIALSGSNVYVAGDTASTDFPRTSGGAQPTNAGYFDGFVARLDLNLSTLQSTYLGGSATQVGSVGLEQLAAIAVSALDGDVYVAGTTDSTNLPGTAGSPQPAFGGVCGPNQPICHDGFAARLTPDLTKLVRASYLGGSGNDAALGLTLSGAIPVSIFQRESMIVAGIAGSTNLPGTTGAAQPLHGGGGADGFVAALGLGTTFRGVFEAVVALAKADCIDAEVGDSLTEQLTKAEGVHLLGQDRAAVETLNGLLREIEAGSGKHIATSCTIHGSIVNPASMLISDVLGLIDELEPVERPTPKKGPAR